MSTTQMLQANDERRLLVQRVILAKPERIFDAWTKPQLLSQWWGPEHVTCTSAEIDLCVGGHYRIENQMADGSTVWISGVFEQIDKPRKLVYSWSTTSESIPCERVTIYFESREEATQISIIHENIPTPELVTSHSAGWEGCLDGLIRFLEH